MGFVPSSPHRGRRSPGSRGGHTPVADRLIGSWFSEAASWSSLLARLDQDVDLAYFSGAFVNRA